MQSDVVRQFLKLGRIKVAESLFKGAGDGVVQIVLHLWSPHRKPFAPKVDFEKRGNGSVRSDDFEIAIRKEAVAGIERFVEAPPLEKLHVKDGDGTVFQGAINLVDAELVSDKEIGDQNFVTRPSRGSKRYVDELRAHC